MTSRKIITDRIRQTAHDLQDILTGIRRDLHRHPERSGEERWTADYLAEKLGRLGLRVRRQVGGHGLVADLITDRSSPTTALRVDMDALPIQEISERPYRSRVPGVMHACGHDVHSAIGIGTAAILLEISDNLPGNVRFLFQPEEEEITGALRMIRAGALSDPPAPSTIYGLHVAPFPAGKLAWTPDLFLAGFEHYLAVLTAAGGGHLTPQQLEAIAHRCCRVIRGFNRWHLPQTWEKMRDFWNILQEGPESLQHFIIYSASVNEINPRAWMGQFGIGIKAADRHLRRAALGRIRAALNTICRATHSQVALEPMGSMPDMRNDDRLVSARLPILNQVLGDQNLIPLKAAFPFNCEDFSYYTKHLPGAMFWLGAANPADGKHAMLHTPDFDVDETCLATGSAAMAGILWDDLQARRASAA